MMVTGNTTQKNQAPSTNICTNILLKDANCSRSELDKEMPFKNSVGTLCSIESNKELTNLEDTNEDQVESYCTDESDCDLELVHWYFSKEKKKDLSIPKTEDPFCNSNQIGDTNQLIKSDISNNVPKPVKTVDGRYSCPIKNCLKSFSTLYLAKLHISSIHLLLEPYTCSLCGVSFSTPRRRHRHYEITHRSFPIPLSCPNKDCFQTFRHSIALTEHLYHCPQKKKKETLRCEICGRSDFIRGTELEKHLLVTHTPRANDNSFYCIYEGCEVLVQNYTALRKHLRSHKDISLQHSCDRPDCDARFYRYADLVTHRRTAHCSQELTCPTCSRVFATSSRYTNHIALAHSNNNDNNHTNSNEFLCSVPLCGKTLASARNMREHIIHSHLQLKFYKCNICYSTFTTRNAAGFHLKKFHSDQLLDKDVIETHYNIPEINTEEAVSRVCTAFQNGVLGLDILKFQGRGICLENSNVMKALLAAANNTAYGQDRKRRRPRRRSNLTNNATQLQPCIVSNESKHNLCQDMCENGASENNHEHETLFGNPNPVLNDSISISVVGFRPQPEELHRALHKKKKKNFKKC